MNQKFFFYYFISILIIILLYILLPIFYGIGGVLLSSLGYFPNVTKEINLNFFRAIFDIPGINKSIFLTLFVGLISTFVSLLISQIILLKVYNTWFYRHLLTIITPLIAFPHVIMAVGISYLFASSGFIFRIYHSYFLEYDRPQNSNLFPDDYGLFLILGLVLKETPFFLLMSINILSQFPSKKYFDLSRTFNNTPMTAWFFFIFPFIYKKLKVSVIIVIIYSASVVDMAYILAPSTPSTISIRILDLFQTPDVNNLAIASCLSLFQFLLILVLISIWVLVENFCKQTFLLNFYLKIFPKKSKILENILFIISTNLFLISLLCIFLSCMWSLTETWNFPNLMPTKLSTDNYTNFIDNFSISIWNTVLIGLTVSLLSCFIILTWLEITDLINFKIKYLEFIFFIPIFIPELSFLLGINFLLIQNNLNGNIWSLIWIETLYVIPYAYLILMPAYRGINKNYIHNAKMLQKSNIKIFFSIKVLLILRTIFLVLGIGALVSIALYTPVYFIGDNQISTLSIEIINFSFSANRKNIGISSVLQMILPLIILFTVFYSGKVFVKWKY